MRARFLWAAAAVLLLSAAPAFADTTVTAYDAARQALLTIWNEMPLTVRNVTLATGTAQNYGNYSVHEGNSYGPGEQIHVYVEVLGYGWKDNGDGTQSILLDADLHLLDANGTTVASQDKFLSTNIVSKQKLLETYLALDARLTSFAAGSYTLQYTLHDRAGGKDTTFGVPIVLTGDAGGSSASSAAPELSSSAQSSSAP